MTKFKAVRSSLRKLAAKQMRAQRPRISAEEYAAALPVPVASFAFDTSDEGGGGEVDAPGDATSAAGELAASVSTTLIGEPDAPDGAAPKVRHCSKCGEAGHTKAKCPKDAPDAAALTDAELEKLTAPDKA